MHEDVGELVSSTCFLLVVISFIRSFGCQEVVTIQTEQLTKQTLFLSSLTFTLSLLFFPHTLPRIPLGIGEFYIFFLFSLGIDKLYTCIETILMINYFFQGKMKKTFSRFNSEDCM